MSSFQFRPAVRENVGLIIGMVGPSGGGKTFSALRIATGLSNGKPFAVIDTEARRALHYADMFKFDHEELGPPFRPDSYAEIIKIADTAKYPVIVVDSVSHEWAGESGILDWQEEELTRMAGTDWKKREACKMASWIKPKMSHKQMIQKLLQIKAHLILCFRAEEKTGMEKDKDGKLVVVQKGWQPICEKNTPYELTMSFLLTPDRPGVPKALKLQEQHRGAVSLSDVLDEDAGKKLLDWASATGKNPPGKKPAENPDKDKPLSKAQGEAIIKIARKLPSPLNEVETRKVIDYYCQNNEHGGRSHAAGQALIFGFETILERYMDDLEKQGGINEGN